jgi:hypothetical protein
VSVYIISMKYRQSFDFETWFSYSVSLLIHLAFFIFSGPPGPPVNPEIPPVILPAAENVSLLVLLPTRTDLFSVRAGRRDEVPVKIAWFGREDFEVGESCRLGRRGLSDESSPTLCPIRALLESANATYSPSKLLSTNQRLIFLVCATGSSYAQKVNLSVQDVCLLDAKDS